MMKLHIFALSASIALVGCNNEQTPVSGPVSLAAPAVVEKAAPAIPPLAERALDSRISAPAWLRKHMPADALAYARVPSLWGLVSAPKGSVLGGALNSKANVEAVVAARSSLGREIGPEGMKLDPVFTLMLQHLSSPIEAVVLKPAADQLFATNVLLTARLDLKTVEEVNALFDKPDAKKSGLRLEEPVTQEKPGKLLVGKTPLLMRFDAGNQRLFLLGGMMPDAALIDKAAAMPEQEPLMLKEEQQIDASGQGLFVWVNTEQLLPVLESMIPPAQMAQMKAVGLDKLKRVAVGMGVAGGKGRLSLLVNAPGLTIPGVPSGAEAPKVMANDLSLKASGTPGTVFILRLPSRASIEMAMTMMKASMKSDGERARFDQGLAKINQQLGFDLPDLFDVFGQEVVIFSDGLSEYFALGVRDDAKLTALLEKLKAKGVKLEDHTTAGTTITHMAMPDMSSQAFLNVSREKPGRNNLPPQVEGMLGRINSHIYWMREGHYLVFSTVPQDLMDRARYSKWMVIGDWLKETQKQPGEASVMQISTRLDDVPRKVYYTYLQGLVFLAEVAGSKFDPFSMPTAQELQLPNDGAYGLQITAGDSLYRIEMNYENNPIEFVASQNAATGAAVVGIMAAIAIPAYQDYKVRAVVSESMVEAASVRTWVTEIYAQNQRFPTAEEIDQKMTDRQIHSKWVSSIKVSADDGVIEIALQGQSQIDGETMTLAPAADSSGQLTWKCTSDTIATRHLPRSCRD